MDFIFGSNEPTPQDIYKKLTQAYAYFLRFRGEHITTSLEYNEDIGSEYPKDNFETRETYGHVFRYNIHGDSEENTKFVIDINATDLETEEQYQKMMEHDVLFSSYVKTLNKAYIDVSEENTQIFHVMQLIRKNLGQNFPNTVDDAMNVALCVNNNMNIFVAKLDQKVYDDIDPVSYTHLTLPTTPYV